MGRCRLVCCPSHNQSCRRCAGVEQERDLTYNGATSSDEPRLTEQKIQKLLAVPKAISEKSPVRGFKEEHNYRRCNLTLETGTDDGPKFTVFIRQSEVFIEDFSIGLRYRTDDKAIGTITLIRYNGAHGEASRHSDGHYDQPHIHRITEQVLASGSKRPEPKQREITDKYISFEQALRAFFEDVGVTNYLEYFPDLRQLHQLDLFNGHQ